MAERKATGLGTIAAGLMRPTTPHDERATPDEPTADVEDIGPMAEPGPTPARASGRTKPGQGGERPTPQQARAARRIKGHTVYLPDDLFERIIVQAHRKGQTLSEYISAMLNRHVPDHLKGRGSADGDAA